MRLIDSVSVNDCPTLNANGQFDAAAGTTGLVRRG